MKNLFLLVFFCLSVALAGCVVDVVEQNTERSAAASGRGVRSANFDASIFRDAFDVQGSSADTLIATGTFSMWSPGSGTASSIAQDVTMYWTIDTLHQATLVAKALGPEQELLSIDKMRAMIPTNAKLFVNTSSNDVSIEKMKGDIYVSGGSSNITFQTDGRISLLQTTSGKIAGTTGLGGTAISTTGDINITVPSTSFESVWLRDSTGNVTLHLPAKAGITFHLQTYGGSINLSYDKVSQTSFSAIDLPVNGGGKVVTVSTATGTITVSN